MNASGLWIYSVNHYDATASFRVTRSGNLWTNWTRRRVYQWGAIKSLTLKRGNKGHEISEFRCVKNAQESEAFDIDSQNTSSFAALVDGWKSQLIWRRNGFDSHPARIMGK